MKTAEKTQHSLPGKVVFGLWKQSPVAWEPLAIYSMWQSNTFPNRGPSSAIFTSAWSSEHSHLKPTCGLLRLFYISNM